MFKKALLVSVSAGLLTACASNWDVEGARGLQPQGGAFETALYEGYVNLAAEERAEYDWDDAAAFLDKARAAAAGQTVLPDAVADRDLPAGAVDEVAAARAALLAELDGGDRQAMPAVAADAQTAYDCWVQELEENIQPDHIAACKTRFDAAMKALTAVVEAPAVDGDYTVYFPLGRAVLDGEALATLNKVVADWRAARPARIVVAGHTDTVGQPVPNLLLSQKRAEAVADYLNDKGIPTADLALEAYGEEQPAVATGDGVTEMRNRRVEITFSGS
ncbi:Outer membrane protein A precursor [Caenispirillum salinarum AK4]|uniref:Outer membrane protein A n=1 Tax=Caenispirillum salinarum AK4 TaxID=1238182 RepID=K9HJH6_9PROT|nr:OmpA family protein [Caenispirillum salinarum]EKV30523.1 Outer membrane protein A precursor [Caenispirillum salinarum AK4]